MTRTPPLQPLDGNVLGGSLLEFFGTDMTAARGACRHCGTVASIAELAVYLHAPGAVVRCRSCESVVIVVVRIHEELRVMMDGFELSDTP